MGGFLFNSDCSFLPFTACELCFWDGGVWITQIYDTDIHIMKLSFLFSVKRGGWGSLLQIFLHIIIIIINVGHDFSLFLLFFYNRKRTISSSSSWGQSMGGLSFLLFFFFFFSFFRAVGQSFIVKANAFDFFFILFLFFPACQLVTYHMYFVYIYIARLQTWTLHIYYSLFF